jgi:hypothetical protein
VDEHGHEMTRRQTRLLIPEPNKAKHGKGIKAVTIVSHSSLPSFPPTCISSTSFAFLSPPPLLLRRRRPQRSRHSFTQVGKSLISIGSYEVLNVCVGPATETRGLIRTESVIPGARVSGAFPFSGTARALFVRRLRSICHPRSLYAWSTPFSFVLLPVGRVLRIGTSLHGPRNIRGLPTGSAARLSKRVLTEPFFSRTHPQVASHWSLCSVFVDSFVKIYFLFAYKRPTHLRERPYDTDMSSVHFIFSTHEW